IILPRDARHPWRERHTANDERDDHDARDGEREATAQRKRKRHRKQRDDDPWLRRLVELRVLPQQLEGRVEGDERRGGKEHGNERVRRRWVASEQCHESPRELAHGSTVAENRSRFLSRTADRPLPKGL